MRHCSVQVRGLLTQEESQTRYDLVYTVQKEIDILILPAIERLKEKSRQRDRDTEAYLNSKLASSSDGNVNENDADET